jgi:hypothetical protein
MITAVLFVLQMVCAQHDHDMEHRGDQAMGFSQQATKHTFRQLHDGGAIEVRARDAKDAKSIDAIREHLRTIAKSFAEGDFAKPQFIHDRMPDGAKEMKELRSVIVYRYQELPRGGRVRITTTDWRAVDAVHRFLKFQIAEHKSGDM